MQEGTADHKVEPNVDLQPPLGQDVEVASQPSGSGKRDVDSTVDSEGNVKKTRSHEVVRVRWG